MYKRVRRFVSYPASVKLMFCEAYILLAWARILKLLPFSKVSPTLGEHMVETGNRTSPEEEVILRTVSKAVHAMSRVTLWESECLVKAIAAMKMLERRKIDSTLYLGSGRDESGKMIAHAWLRSGAHFVTGNVKLERYAVVAKFGRHIPLTSAEQGSPLSR